MLRLTALPQKGEALGLFLPRSLLDWAEIYAIPEFISEPVHQESLSFWKSRRVALVRQTAYRGAYLPGVKRNWTDVVLSANAHLGPFSFLAELNADYFVTRQTPDPETYLWKGKFANDPNPETAYRDVEAWQEEQEAMDVVDCNQIRWDDYDLVVCLDIPIPTHIVSKSKKTIWAYYSVEAGGTLHKSSTLKPVSGYHFYLNHCFRRYRTRPVNQKHVIEFPFTFQSSNAWKILAKQTSTLVKERHGGVMDRASWQASSDPKPTFITPLLGDSIAYIQLMSSRQFAIRIESKTRWGNWALEAIQAGCLFMGRADSLAMRGVLLPDLIAQDLPSAQKMIEALLKDPRRMGALAQIQAALAEHLAFRRPLMDLTVRAKQFLQS